MVSGRQANRLCFAGRDLPNLDATISIEELVAKARHRVYRKLTAEERRNLMLPPTG